MRKGPTRKARGPGSASPPDAANVELVFGFVGPTGIDLDKVCEVLRSQLKAMQYEAIEIRLSDLITDYLGQSHAFANRYERIKSLMERGTALREQSGLADVVGRLAVAAIRAFRLKRTGDVYKPASRVAYVIRSFKRPEEVELFRQVYDRAFTLISVYASRAARLQYIERLIAPSLATRKSHALEYASELLARDHEEEGRNLGQRVGRTFPLADYFVTGDSRPGLEAQLKRLLQLTFGNPYISPTRDEQAMFIAKAAALRSLDLSRQVGAAVVSQAGDLIATGCNEVPCFGGGLYWGEDPSPGRDYERGSDSNVDVKREIVEDTFDRLRRHGLLAADQRARSNAELADGALFGTEPYLRDAQLFDVIEFGRAVHAEMAAITHAARVGARLQDARLFSTTFPCHLCARHIVAAGIREVVFIEPYEKSRSAQLYEDSISVEPAETSVGRVNFLAFVGVAPRRYVEFFESRGVRKSAEGKIKRGDQIASHPPIERLVITYTLAEAIVVEETGRLHMEPHARRTE